MAHPKRRQSKTRTAKRRTHDKAVAPTLAICPNCGEWQDRKSTRLNSSHTLASRMPSSA